MSGQWQEKPTVVYCVSCGRRWITSPTNSIVQCVCGGGSGFSSTPLARPAGPTAPPTSIDEHGHQEIGSSISPTSSMSCSIPVDEQALRPGFSKAIPSGYSEALQLYNDFVEHQQPKEKFEGGATRSTKLERYDLIPPEAEAAAARRYGLGARLHGEGNWKSGGKNFVKATVNHLKAHLVALLGTEPTSTDNIDALIWNAMALAWYQARKPEAFKEALEELRNGLVQ